MLRSEANPLQSAPMRPPVLNPLFASLTSLSGVGPKLVRLYARLLDRDAPRVVDLLFHLPSGMIDRRARPKLRDVQPGQVVTVAVTIGKHRPGPPRRSRAPYRVYASDDTGDITLTFFNPHRDYLEKLLPEGELGMSPALPNSTTACCRWFIPTASWMKPALPRCLWSSRFTR